MITFHSIHEPFKKLSDGEVHIYTSPTLNADRYRDLLTDAELSRADRFRMPRVRDQFITTRGTLRFLLGHYLNAEPRSVEILYADGGKPYLPAQAALQFNVSHTDGMAVLGFSRSRVGVDVERHRDMPDAADLVNRFFTPRESAIFASIPESRRMRAFFQAWTRKEAILKALGRGIQSLDTVEVNFENEDPPLLLVMENDLNTGDRWSMQTWEPGQGFIAAVAFETAR